MNLDEYKKRMEEQDDWAPGWEAIDQEFEKMYPSQTPAHYGTAIHKRAMLGGDQYLDGYSIYESKNGYKHILTYGMTELYTNAESFDGEWSRWGYEMTMKIKGESPEDCLWVLDMLSNLAFYTYSKEKYFEPYQYISGNGSSLHIGTDSAITALIVINDTEAQGIETVHGKVDFLQLVGITQSELEKLKEDPTISKQLIETMKSDNPFLVTDMSRTKSYI